jgi:predicted nuclease of predicted toxin-antitoxin system
LGDPDREHLSYVVENDWILVTFDDDFLSLVEGSGFDHAGIIHGQQAGRDIGDVVKAVDAHLESGSEDDRGIHYC